MNPPRKGPSAEETASEAIAARFEVLDRRLNKIAELIEANNQQIEANTSQIASFTEGLTRLENLIERGFSNIDNRLDAIARTAERQQATVDRLVDLVASQAATVNRLIDKAS